MSAVAPAAEAAPLLSVRNLTVDFNVPAKGRVRSSKLRAVAGVDLDVEQGQILGVVGESGCGKSTTGRAILQLIRPSAGSVTFGGRDLVGLGRRELRAMRARMQMVFQDPYASLNPRMSIGALIEEPLLVHTRMNAVERRAKAVATMSLVGLREAWHGRYPHEFSGGQRQRVGIARALVSDPDFIVADEPVSALDVSVQAQTVNLLQGLQEELGLTMMFIAHDLAVVRHLTDDLAVMYLGKVIESGPTEELYRNPRHPYTQALLSAVPIPDPHVEVGRERVILRGDVPSPLTPPTGCRFRTRCWKATDLCASAEPPMVTISAGHEAACHYPEAAETAVKSAS